MGYAGVRNVRNGQSRRAFLRRGLACAMGAASMGLARDSLAAVRPAGKLTIERIELFPVLYPTLMRFKFFEGPAGSGRASVIVKVTASDGTVGWGESIPSPRWSYETFEGVQAAIEHYLKPVLLGRDVFDLAGAHTAMNRELADSFSTGSPIAKAGIDIALHDVAGKATGLNLAQLWGRAPGNEIALSWTLNPKTLDDLEPLIAKGKERGYRNFNVKVGPDPEFDVAMCRRVRELVPDGFLWGDANGGYDLPAAMEAAPRLADAGMDVLEQPLKANRLSGYAQLKRQGALPIILDEGVVSASDLIEFIRLDCCDGVAMKVPRCAGVGPAARQIRILEDAGLMFLGSGLTDPDISMAASLILYGAFGLQYPAALNGPQFLGAGVIQEPFTPVEGKVRVPQGPGLGIKVDEERVKQLVEETKAQAARS